MLWRASSKSGAVSLPRARRTAAIRGSTRPAGATSRPENRNPPAAARAGTQARHRRPVPRPDRGSSDLVAHALQSTTSARMLHWANPRKMHENSSNGAGQKFQRLVEIMARLRAPGGCPWDREQTFDSIKPYTLEETYEVLDAIDRRDWDELRAELGDFMLQAVFFAQMASEEKLFDIGDSLDAINEKLVRRHPHVFADETARDRRRRQEALGRDQSGGEETQRGRAAGLAGQRSARLAGAGRSAADYLARGARRFRLEQRG